MDFNQFSGTELPHSVEAEQSVLGAIIIDREVMSVVLSRLQPDSFYIVMHKKLFEIISDQFTVGKSSDLITVISESVTKKIFDSEGSARDYIQKITDGVVTTKNISDYCDIVEEKYILRSLITASKDIIDECYTSTDKSSDILDRAEQLIYNIRQGKISTDLKPIKEVVLETYNELEKKSGADADLYRGISSGFGALDSVITGLNKSDLIIVAARPAMGKTAFVLNIAANVCRNKEHKDVAIFSLEMSNEQLVTRMLSSESLVDSDKLVKGKIDTEDWEKLLKGAKQLSSMNIYLDDNAGATIGQMKAKLRRVKNLGVVIIDYLQLMSTGKKTDNRVNEISELTRQLKLLAKDLNVPVIVLSQLSRSVESRTDKRPVLSDLRDSGSIEQDADIVMFLYRDYYYNKEKCEDPTLAECLVAKNRHGEIGTVKLRWNGQYTLFLGYDKQEYNG